MTKDAQSVLADALRLDEKARAELVVELLASLDVPDPDAAAAWEKEIERRVKELDGGRKARVVGNGETPDDERYSRPVSRPSSAEAFAS